MMLEQRSLSVMGLIFTMWHPDSTLKWHREMDCGASDMAWIPPCSAGFSKA